MGDGQEIEMFKFWRKKQDRKKVWNDTMIDLYERQIAAREAMGVRWKCHPANSVPRKLFYKGVEVILDGSSGTVPTVFPPKLRLVK